MVEALGAWGIRWVGELGEEDLDPHLLMWDIRRTVPVDELAPGAAPSLRSGSTGVAPKAAAGGWWCPRATADICDFDPGYEVDAHRGHQPAHPDRDLARRRVLVALPDGRQRDGVRVADARREVPAWLGQSLAAAIPRPA